MIYGITDNLYEVPSIVPIKVTILRGARKLRFSSKLQQSYKDFAPNLWEILSFLGYKKYLQRIYIDVDYNFRIKTSSLQIPILLSTLSAVGLFTTKRDIITYGKLDNRKIILPLQKIDKYVEELDFNVLPINNERLTNYMERILKSRINVQKNKKNWESIYKAFFPQTIIKESRIDIITTQNNILKKIPIDLYSQLPVIIDLNQLTVCSKSKIEFIRSLPIKDIKLTNTNKANANIRNLLSINAWRIEVPF